MSGFAEYEGMAMLEFSQAERDVMKVRFDEIVAGFSALDAYDTSDAEPLVSVSDAQNVLREDISAKLVSRAELLGNAPEHNDEYFQVPATID